MATDSEELKWMRLPEVMKMTGLSRSSIYQLMKDGKFPKSIRISERTTVWVYAEVQTWMQVQMNIHRRGLIVA